MCRQGGRGGSGGCWDSERIWGNGEMGRWGGGKAWEIEEMQES